ncbi:hypothetical protein PILCRDRAFT_813627 [Piloderma croceum F 1598]|uniref:Homeobox domain-containing protein n=1 Tax=Piloderma croceum (strain F 1598) TaxID=765440 RepID=A0A0C3GDE2_PILCF|nr:hypothetical protein PILCRDRAFT_813627 [Piloderma croceum F 1598]
MSSATEIDAGIRQRLDGLEGRLLQAIDDGPSAVASFLGNWSSLQLAIASALQNQSLDYGTVLLAKSVSKVVGIVAETFHDLQNCADEITVSFVRDISFILDDHAAKDVLPTHPSQHSAFFLHDKRHPCPPYVASAYKWLRHNIHKPYPTVEEIKSICANSDTNEKRIRNWFITARRRMGWSKIAKEHFHSDREDTADAAYRALVEPDPKRPIEAKLMFEFVKMEVAAEGMYSSAFKPSQLAGSLGTTVVGMSMEHKARIEEMRQQAIEEENIQKAVEHQMKRQRMTKRNGFQRKSVSLYPSPERSSCSSPEPTLVLSETEEDETVISPPGTADGRKRHRSLSSDTLDSHVDKRHKSVTATSSVDSLTSLPSPSASAEGHHLDYCASSNMSPIDPKPSTPSHISRKRRLSNADVQGPPKRPRGLTVRPRLHTVSDPLPISSTVVQALEVQNWNMPNFEFNFELPNTVISQPLDPSVPIDVEFFNWTNDFACANDSFSPNHSSLSAQQVDLPAAELFSSTAPAFDMSGSSGSAFDQFLQDMLSQPTESQVSDTSTFSQTSLLPQPSTESVGAVSDDWSAYVESVPPAQDPVIVDPSSQPYGFIDLSSIPNFDPSMLKPPSPPSPADIIAQNEAAAKQLKLRQCYAHLEAAMKLQQEITTGND